jgi:hypothetical protein
MASVSCSIIAHQTPTEAPPLVQGGRSPCTAQKSNSSGLDFLEALTGMPPWMMMERPEQARKPPSGWACLAKPSALCLSHVDRVSAAYHSALPVPSFALHHTPLDSRYLSLSDHLVCSLWLSSSDSVLATLVPRRYLRVTLSLAFSFSTPRRCLYRFFCGSPLLMPPIAC